jgi:hypothetical protein
MKPLSVQPWPPRKRHLDRLVPVIEGREVRFHCVYVAAPCLSLLFSKNREILAKCRERPIQGS